MYQQKCPRVYALWSPTLDVFTIGSAKDRNQGIVIFVTPEDAEAYKSYVGTIDAFQPLPDQMDHLMALSSLRSLPWMWYVTMVNGRPFYQPARLDSAKIANLEVGSTVN